MIIRGHYVGLEFSELERIKSELHQALKSMREGKTFSEVDMGGKMGKKQLLSYNEVVHELKEIEFALKKALPEVYGKPIKRLIPNFNKTLEAKPRIGIGAVVRVEGASLLTGGVLSDGEYYYDHRRSHLTLQEGYYLHTDTLSQIAKLPNGKWGLFGGAGVMFDEMNAVHLTPLTQGVNKWQNIIVR